MRPSFNATSYYDRPGHRWYPARGDGHAFGELELGDSYIRFHEAAEIDAVIAELTALRAEMTADDAWQQRPGWCMASTSPREGLTVHCDLPKGHDGGHCSPGWDEGEPDTSWSDEPASVAS